MAGIQFRPSARGLISFDSPVPFVSFWWCGIPWNVWTEKIFARAVPPRIMVALEVRVRLQHAGIAARSRDYWRDSLCATPEYGRTSAAQTSPLCPWWISRSPAPPPNLWMGICGFASTQAIRVIKEDWKTLKMITHSPGASRQIEVEYQESRLLSEDFQVTKCPS